MARKALDIGIRLERQEKKILKLRQELEEAQDLYEKLLEEKAEADREKLFEAYKKSKRSLDEIVGKNEATKSAGGIALVRKKS